MPDLSHKVAIVTGAASGLGRAIALTLAECGARITIADINLAGAMEVKDEIESQGGQALALLTDVAEDQAVRQTVLRTAEQFGGVDILVNNAADLRGEFLAGDGDVVTMDLATWERTIAVNLTGTMLGCRYAIPEMQRRGGGSIINMSTGSSMLGDIDHSAYGASKGGINTLTKYVATAFGKDGIRCNAIAAGIIVNPQILARHPQESLDEWTSHHLTPRLGVPADVADAVAFLASDRSGFWTGQIVVIDGGMSSHLPSYSKRIKQSER